MQVGIDLVAVNEVREALAVHGERYLRRVYTDTELAQCQHAGRPDPVALAARFAAKEAALKALGIDTDAVSWREIEIEVSANHPPALSLHGHAAKLAERAGVRSFSLSLARERERAMAVVVSRG